MNRPFLLAVFGTTVLPPGIGVASARTRGADRPVSASPYVDLCARCPEYGQGASGPCPAIDALTRPARCCEGVGVVWWVEQGYACPKGRFPGRAFDRK